MVNSMIKSLEKVPISVIEESKMKRRRLKVGDPDFKPPDGGWGWLVVFACGFSNLSLFPMFQQFGLIFHSKFEELGITKTQTTTIININSAFNASMGLLNGPLFRKFSYRQIAMFGSCLVATSLFLSTFCESFWTYIIFYAICYGSGIGITQSSNALALNTYFESRRRIATGLSWSMTALGPIVWPFIITALLDIYGMEGTLMLFSAFASHAFMCSLLLQPVDWHTKFRDVEDGNQETSLMLNSTEKIAPTKLNPALKSRSLLSSQYLLNEDNPIDTGYEIIDPGFPMMVRANDGWYSQNHSQAGSRISLTSNKPTSRVQSGQNSLAVSKRPSYNNLNDSRSKRNSSVNLQQDGKDRSKRDRKSSYSKIAIREEEEANENGNNMELPDEKEILKSAAKKLEDLKQQEIVRKILEDEKLRISTAEENENKTITLWQKIYIFFDLDLFKDVVYLNLMLGITIANFAELNFSILTPAVLREFEFGKYQIATFMSLLGTSDILVRFFVPFLADKIGWDNKTFFLVGVLSMAFGRIILVHTQSYYVSLGVAVMIGSGKGLRTIFMALVIPGYVPLERLPAASGLQLATSGLLFIILGPIVGWVHELVGTYVITLHLLNICTYATAVAWTIEKFIPKKKL